MIVDKCPFKVAAAAPRGFREPDMRCDGVSCMMFVKTAIGANGQPIGGCAPAISASQLFTLNKNIAALAHRLGIDRPPWYVRLWRWIKSKFEKPPPPPIPLHPITPSEPDAELPPTA